MFTAQGAIKLVVQTLIIMVMILIIKKVIKIAPLPQVVKTASEEV